MMAVDVLISAVLPLRAALIAAALGAASLGAQMTHVIPFGTATANGTTANVFPWGTSGSGLPGLRVQACYDGSNFLNGGINSTIVITRLRWRADSPLGSWAGGTYNPATISLSTAAVNWNAVGLNWSANHGFNLTQCYNGPVMVQPWAGGATGLGPFVVDVTLSSPFLYYPGGGDLIIDTDWQSGAYSGGSLPALDVDGLSTTLASSVFGSVSYPAATSPTLNYGLVVEVTYSPLISSIARATVFGEGCYDHHASFYELFPPSTFDLSNQVLRLLPNASGYDVVAGAPAWFTPVSAPLVIPSSRASGPHALPISFPFPGASTQEFWISGMGFVWAQPTPNLACCQANAQHFLADLPRFAGLWSGFGTVPGSVHLDYDAATNAVYVTFLGVPEFGSLNSNTFQMAFFATGEVEYRYQQCAITTRDALVGWTPGFNARDPGSVDLSAALPISTAPDMLPLSLGAAQRPIINTSVVVTVRDIPPSGLLGAFVGGVAQHLPGLSLAAFGMPGCLQHSSQEAVLPVIASGGQASFTLVVPNSQALAGTSVYLQAVVLVPGVNAVGALTSNGLEMHIGLL